MEASATLQNVGASLLTVGDEEPEKRMVATKILFNVVNNVLEALIETDEQDSTATDTVSTTPFWTKEITLFITEW